MTRRRSPAAAPIPEPSPNGDGSPKKRSRRKKTVDPGPIDRIPDPIGDTLTGIPGSLSRESIADGAVSLEDIAEESVTWLVPDYIPRHSLTIVVGATTTGKSTFGAWLMSQAHRPVVMPGYEDPLGTMFRSRVRAAGVDARRCIMLVGRPWMIPDDSERLQRLVSRERSDLVWIDPIDSYISDHPSQGGDHVRRALESLMRISQETGCTVVGVRHPGKEAANIMVGVRHWRNVPRRILLLASHGDGPDRRTIAVYKESYGLRVPVREYALVGEEGEPPRWVMGDAVDPKSLDIDPIPDEIERSKIDEAMSICRELLALGPVESQALWAEGAKERLDDRTMRRAMRRLGARPSRHGNVRDHRSVWSIPAPESDSGTPDSV